MRGASSKNSTFEHNTPISLETKTDHDAAGALYGDMVVNIFSPIMVLMLLFSEDTKRKRNVAMCILSAMIFSTVATLLAVFLKSVNLSRLAFLIILFTQGIMNLVEWPYEGECTISPSFQGGVMLGVLANVSLSFSEKMVRLAALFVVGSYVSIKSPHSVYLEDVFPILGGTILLAIFGLYVIHFGVQRQMAAAQGARLILAALFIYHTATNMSSQISSSNTAYNRVYALLKPASFATVGVIATGVFQKEIILKEQLEVLVQKRTAEIQEQNQKLRMVNVALQASETAIAITDERGYIIWLNTAFENLCGKKEEFLIGRLLKDLIWNLDRTRKRNEYVLMESCVDTTASSEDELQIGEATFRLEVTPFPENAKDVKLTTAVKNRLLMVFKDITADRARQLAEKKAKDEAMMAKAMGDAMVTLTHELRTPLQGTMGITSLLLQSNDLSDDAMESLKLIMASSSLLLNLINNLLDVKKDDAKMLGDVSLVPISASSVIEDALAFCQPLASISNVLLEIDTSLSPNATVQSNSLRLQQVLINLFSNAIKYTRSNTKIKISTFESTMSNVRVRMDRAVASSCDVGIMTTSKNYNSNRAVLIFNISDVGPGIAPDQAHRIFRRYAQLDHKPSRTLGSCEIGQPSGTGLGLHLCQMFVHRMNGYMWVTNNEGGDRGSTFSFCLQLISKDTSHDNTDRSLSSHNEEPIIASRCGLICTRSNLSSGPIAESDNMYQIWILVVDDSIINQKVFAKMLKTIGFSNVTTVDCGESALIELTKKKNYELVITDLQMPGMSGMELSRKIVASSTDDFQKPVVVGLTADTSSSVSQQCQTSGMSDVLYKPITVDEMQSFVETKLPQLKFGVWGVV